MVKLDLSSIPAYQESARRLANELLSGYASAEEVERDQDALNAYSGLGSIGPPRSILVLEEQGDDLADLGREAVLAGEVYWEHTAAGEATRLMMGPKFFITPDMLSRRLPSDRRGGGPAPLARPFPLELGRRHLAQLAYEIARLADESGVDPAKALARQRMLVVGAEDSMPALLPMVARDLSGLFPLGSLRFMAQAQFPGLRRMGGSWEYDPGSPRRPHNHGAMAMQKTMGGQIFRVDESGRRYYLGREESLAELGSARDLVSYNIEDLGYLTRALDFGSIGLAVRMGGRGKGMMMEISANNPERPIKGGCCAFDPFLGRDVMIESLRLKGRGPEDIPFLNKNFNHYPNPAVIFRALSEYGLFMPVLARGPHVYFQPVQGDLNFLADTVFFVRKGDGALNSLKSEADIRPALEAFLRQDGQPGFLGLAEGILSGTPALRALRRGAGA